MELSPRLQSIARQVPQGARLADVGTDHSYLPVWLLLDGRIERAIAADLRAGPLDRAKQTAQQYGQMENISFRLCDGLADIDAGEVDIVVIAGMGGETIAAILEAAPWTRQDKLLLLQPMTGASRLRQWLQVHNYAIEKETIASEANKLYSIWTVRGGSMPPLSPAELWAGTDNDDPLRPAYLDMLTKKAEKALRGHLAAQNPDQTVITHLETVLSGLRKMKKEWKPNDHSG